MLALLAATFSRGSTQHALEREWRDGESAAAPSGDGRSPPDVCSSVLVYEAETNLIIHSTNGGVLRVQVEPHRILMQTSDDGPGIPDVKQALQPGWSTASQEARSMGFGAGMGLVNIRRCVDKMEVDSTPSKGTKLLMEIHLRAGEKFKSPPGASEAPGV